MYLGSGVAVAVAVAVAGSYSSGSTPNWELPYVLDVALKSKKTNKKQRKKKKEKSRGFPVVAQW